MLSDIYSTRNTKNNKPVSDFKDYSNNSLYDQSLFHSSPDAEIGNNKKKETPTAQQQKSRKQLFIFATILAGIVLLIILLAFFFWLRTPSVDIIQLASDPSRQTVYNLQSGLILPWVLKLKIENPNFFTASIDKVNITGYSKSLNLHFGEGVVRNVKLDKKMTGHVDLPYTISIKPPFKENNLKALALIYQACSGDPAQRRKLDIRFTIDFGFKVLARKKRISPIQNLKFDCPSTVDQQAMKYLAAASGVR